MLRQAAVAGHFYEGSSAALRKQVEAFLIPRDEPSSALGILSPHAGLMYSGAVAGAVYSSITIPETIVLIGPNHTGLGTSVSLMAAGEWETPLGRVKIDEGLAASILSKSSRIHDDALAHLREHSLEVQLPFLQYLKQQFKIVPIQILDARLETCLEIGRAVAESIAERVSEAVSRSGRDRQTECPDVLIIASSDMSHYEPAKNAKEKDFTAIDRILKLDPEGLHRAVKDRGITMCGYAPAVAMLSACKALGADDAELIAYANSGDVSGDYHQVVGYAGIVVRRKGPQSGKAQLI